MKRPLLLGAIFTLYSLSVQAQGKFEEKYDDCGGKGTCFYCGDSIAHYKEQLGKYFKWQIEHSYNIRRYDTRNFDVLYEVYVDSTGRTCVTSIQSIGLGSSWLMKDDVRKWLIDMPDWTPAIKNGTPINSSVIIELSFRNNFFSANYISPEAADKLVNNKEKDDN